MNEARGVLSTFLEDLQLRLEDAERKLHRCDRPFVTLAYAQSLDGSIAGLGNRRLSLSSKASLTLTHELRAGHDAILVGIGTVLADNPRLNVRLVNGSDPQPIVVDSRLSLPLDARILENGQGVWIAATPFANPAAAYDLEARGAHVLTMPALANGWVDLEALLRTLANQGVSHVLVEGGARILTSFLQSRLADFAVVTVSPKFVGGVRVLVSSELSPHPRLASWRAERVGDDVVLAGEITWSSE